MTQGHLLALQDAPILSADTLSVVAYWARDVRAPTFVDRITLQARQPVLAAVTRPAHEATQAAEIDQYDVLRVFARGPLQIWQLTRAVKPEDIPKVFGSDLFRLAPGPFLNDPVRVRAACQTLLHARDYPLSDHTRDEIENLSFHLQRTGKVRPITETRQ